VSEKHQNPMTIEQAGNLLKQKRENNDLLKCDTDGSPTNVDPKLITSQLRAIVKTHLPVGEMRTFMLIRISGTSTKEIARHYNVPESLVEKFEELGKDHIKKCLQKDPCYRREGLSSIISGAGITKRSSLII